MSVSKKITKNKQLITQLKEDISIIFRQFTDDYSGALENELMQDVVSDVIECSDFENGYYATGDIKLAIGRVLCNRLGIER